MAADDFDTTVEGLYGAPPAQFIATRNAAVKRARAAGDRDLADRIKQLRRPTAAAALLNQHLRSGSTGDLDALIALGEKLRTAQRELDVRTMRSLGAQRAPRITAVLDAIGTESGDELTATVREQLSQTLTAAVADADAAQAVRSGRLVSALSYSGFGEVDLSEAVAVPLARSAQRPHEARDEDAEEPDAQQEPDAAAEADAAAERHLEERLAALTEAERAEASAQRSADLAERALAAARRTAQGARARLAEASAARETAQTEVAEARRRIRRS